MSKDPSPWITIRRKWWERRDRPDPIESEYLEATKRPTRPFVDPPGDPVEEAERKVRTVPVTHGEIDGNLVGASQPIRFSLEDRQRRCSRCDLSCRVLPLCAWLDDKELEDLRQDPATYVCQLLRLLRDLRAAAVQARAEADVSRRSERQLSLALQGYQADIERVRQEGEELRRHADAAQSRARHLEEQVLLLHGRLVKE